MKSLEEIEQDAILRNIPIMQKEGLFFMISKMKEHHVSSCLEIGTAIGYSAMMMVTHLPDLHVETIEINEDLYQEALSSVRERGLSNRIILHHHDALTFDETKLELGFYDCLFIDGAKAQYQKFFEKYIPYVKDQGIVIVDNLDFHGMINDIDHIKNRNTRQLVKKIKRFRDWIFHHEDYNVTYYHVGDGICVIQRKEKQ